MARGFTDSNGTFHPIGGGNGLSSRKKNIDSFGMLLKKFEQGKNEQVLSEISGIEDQAFDETENWWNDLTEPQREDIAERFEIDRSDFESFEIPKDFRDLDDFDKHWMIFAFTGVGDLNDEENAEFFKKQLLVRIDEDVVSGDF